MLAVEQLVLEEDDRVVGADRGLEQALGVGRAIGRDHDQPGHVRVPAAVILAVLGADAAGGAVGPAEHDRAAHLPARHVIGLGGRIDDVVDRLHREVEGHELDDRPQPAHRRAGAEAGKAIFGDRRVDDALGAELLEQALRDLVGALIFGDLLAHHEHALVARASPRPSRRAAPRAPSCVTSGVPSGTSGSSWVVATSATRSRAAVSNTCGVGVASACCDAGLRRLRRLAASSRLRRGCGAAAAGASLTPRPRRPAARSAAPTFTPSVPSGTRILAIVPSSTASNSIVALSVSISARMSPDLTVVAFLDQPFGERALLHRRGQRGHLELDRHQ